MTVAIGGRCNAEIKQAIRQWYFKWKTKQLEQVRSKGHVKLNGVKMDRMELIVGIEKVFADFNMRQNRV